MKKDYPRRDPNRCPTHPGAILREDVLPNLKKTKTEIAQALGLSRQVLYAILHEEQRVTPETAVKLAAAIGGSARSWLNMQAAYDLWHAEKEDDVSRVPSLVECHC
jgi:antitoxin HigA-1